MSLPEAVVFDCDGTIADTESVSNRAWTRILADRGYVATEDDFHRVIGYPFAQTWEYFSRRVPLGDRRRFRSRLRELFLSLLDEGLDVFPDAVDTMHALARRRVSLAVASSSSRGHVERVLERAGVGEVVEVVVGADDVTRHKPDPRPYARAVELLGVGPGRSCAVEDTAVGVLSATRAGLFAVGIVRAHTRPGDLAGAGRVVEEITVRACTLPSAHGATG